MIHPQLTALMTTYNVGRFVSDTIQSVLAQIQH